VKAGSAISLFTGAMGLDLGFEKAGFNIKVAVESNKWAAETIRVNRPNIKLIEKPIETITTSFILETAGLKVREPSVVVGGPCCQSFSTAGSRESLGDPRGTLFHRFVDVIKETEPRFFVMENVPGILSAAIKHRPLNKRGPGFPTLSPEEELGSAFKLILKEFESTNYYVIFALMNAADYGAPQARQRVIIIGSKDGEELKIPTPTHSKDGLHGKNKWVTLREALTSLDDSAPEYTPLPKTQKKFLRQIPPGGNWHDLPQKLQKEALGGAYNSWGGRSGFLRRLSWDKPSPAITTSPTGKATMLCHPDELRPLSIKEYTKLQQFPDDWFFAGNLTQKYIQIGNAVPVGLGYAIAKELAKIAKSKPNGKSELRGKVLCADPILANRLAHRPKTMLNPLWMRPKDTKEDTKKWLDNS